MAEANIHFRKFDPAYETMMVTVHVTEEWKIRQTIGFFMMKIAMWIGTTIMGFGLEIVRDEGPDEDEV